MDREDLGGAARTALEQAWPLYVARIETLLEQLSALTGQEFVDRLNASISNLDLGIIDTEVPDSFLLSRGLIVLAFGAIAGAIGSLVGLRRYLQESK